MVITHKKSPTFRNFRMIGLQEPLRYVWRASRAKFLLSGII